VESNLGYLEFELCKEWGLTPKELGEKRKHDPEGVSFLERTMIYRWEQQHKAHKEAERKSKAKSHRRR